MLKSIHIQRVPIEMKNYHQYVNVESTDVLNGQIQMMIMWILLTNECVLILWLPLLFPVHKCPLVIHVNEKSMFCHVFTVCYSIKCSLRKVYSLWKLHYKENRCRRVESMKTRAPTARNEFFMRTSLYMKLNLKGNWISSSSLLFNIFQKVVFFGQQLSWKF